MLSTNVQTLLQRVKFFCGLFLLLSFTFFSCSAAEDVPIVIWTDNAAVVSYAELFNASQESAKAVVVYKEDCFRSLPPAKDEIQPDILISSLLKNSEIRKYFSPVDYLFNEKLSRADYYSKLLDYGLVLEHQYLIPISFNVDTMVFNKKNEALVHASHSISLDEVREVSKEFNQVNQNGVFTAMGYAPSWDSDFLFASVVLRGADFVENENTFLWNEDSLKNTLGFLRDWTQNDNEGFSTEQNFAFKYLYMPKYRQLLTERCLFSCMPSNELFALNPEQLESLSFRWLENDGKIAVREDIVTAALYKKTKNAKKAEIFFEWLCSEKTQKALLEREKSMNLDTRTFGIAGGFSALKSVNTKIYPSYYRALLENQPPESKLTVPEMLPPRWTSLKEKVLLPYLTENLEDETTSSLEDRIADWLRQSY